MNLYKYIGKLAYDGTWEIQPEHDKTNREPGWGLKDLNLVLPASVGTEFTLRVRREALERLHTEFPSEPSALATRDAWEAAKNNKPVKVLMGTKTVTRGRNHRMKTIIKDYPSDRHFVRDVYTALALLHPYPNNMIFEIVEESTENSREAFDDIPAPRVKKRGSK